MAQAGVRIGALELLFGTVNMNERVLYLQTCTGAAIERIDVRTARQGIIKLDNYLVSLRIWRVVTPKICNRASHSSIPMSLHFSRLQLRDCREMYRKTNPQTIRREGGGIRIAPVCHYSAAADFRFSSTSFRILLPEGDSNAP